MKENSVVTYNREHASAPLNDAAYKATFTACISGIVAAVFAPTVNLPYIGQVSSSRRSIFIELVVLTLLLNTQSLYTHYVTRFRIPLTLHLLGMIVYAFHFVAALVGFLYPTYWMRAVWVVLFFRLLVSLGLFFSARRSAHDALVKITRMWLRHSFIASCVMSVAALAAEWAFKPSTWFAIHGFPVNVATVPIVNAFVSDIQTIVDGFLCAITCTFALWNVTYSDRFSQETVERFQKEITEAYAARESSHP